MRPISPNPMVKEGLPIVRPLLCTTRDYIEHYLRDKRGLEWVTDSTNSDTTISRNAIREQLKSYSKAEIEHMAQTAEYVQGYIEVKTHAKRESHDYTKIFASADLQKLIRFTMRCRREKAVKFLLRRRTKQ